MRSMKIIFFINLKRKQEFKRLILIFPIIVFKLIVMLIILRN